MTNKEKQFIRYRTKKLNGSASETYTDSSSGMIPTDIQIVQSLLEPVRSFFPKDPMAPVLIMRPLSFDWAKELIYKNVTIWSFWVKNLLNHRTEKIAKSLFGNTMQMMTRTDYDNHVDSFKKITGKALKNASPEDVKKYVNKHIKRVFKLITGNLPFGHHTDTQGQYICWPILYLNFFMLDQEDGVMTEIVPISLFNPFKTSIIEKLYNLILPHLEYLDLDTNAYFKKAGNEPGITMCAFTINMAKKDDIVRVRRYGKTHLIKHNDLMTFLYPDYILLTKVQKAFNLSEVKCKDIYVSDVRQNIGKIDDLYASKRAMIKNDQASDKYSSKFTEQFYYSSVTKLWTTPEIKNKLYNKTTGQLKVVFNYNGHMCQFNKEKKYMPIDHLPIGKCAEGIPVKDIWQGDNVRTTYTRKLPLWFSETIKGPSNKYNGALYLLPWFPDCVHTALTHDDWYDAFDIKLDERKVIDAWYKKYTKK